MEMRNTEEITKEVMKSEALGKEIARYRINQAELQEKVPQQQLTLALKQVTLNTNSIL